MAIKKACIVSNAQVKNTGKECDTIMGATAMIIAIDPSVKFTEDDLVDPNDWLTTLVHQKKAYPLFGQKAPIRTITNNSEADLTITLDDGSRIFVRYGMYNRTFQTTSGGLCYASALMSFLNSGMSIIEIDKSGQMLVRKNSDKTLGGISVDNMYAPSPVLATLSDVWRSQFQYSVDPVEYVQNGVILEGATSLLSEMGLIDAEVVQSGAGAAGYLQIKIQTECAEADLIPMFGNKWNDASLYTVIDKITKAEIAVTGVTTVDGALRLAGTFTAGRTYIVSVINPEGLLAKDIAGYEVKSGEVVAGAAAGGGGTTYNTTISQADTENASVAGTGFDDPDQKLEFNSVSPITGLPITMTIMVGGIPELTVDTYSDYNGRPFRYTSKGGDVYTANFIDGTHTF